MAARGASVASLLVSLRKRRASLPAEMGAFAVLELVEAMRKARMAVVDEHTVTITDEGQVTIGAPITQDERAAVQSACTLLASLLSVAGRPPSQQLMRLAVPADGQGVITLAALRDDLEASLVPLNRQASRRVLARMVREMSWESQQADELNDLLSAPLPEGAAPQANKLAPRDSASVERAQAEPTPPRAPTPSEPPTMDELDLELSRILRTDRPPAPDGARVPAPDSSRPFRVSRPPTDTFGDGDAPLPRPPRTPDQPRAVENDNDSAAQLRQSAWGSPKSPPPASLKLTERPPEPAADAHPTLRPAASSPQARTVVDSELASAARPPAAFGSARPVASEHHPLLSEPPHAGGKGVWLGIGLGALALALVGTVFWLRPDLRARLDGTEAPPVTPTPAPAPAPKRGGELVVHVDVERAQVLRFAGRGPALLSHVDTGLVHELVAFADGHVPTRLLVSKDAEWEKTEAGLRLESAMQLAPGKSDDVGESLLTRDVGAPSSRYGELRVVTTPKGAKVYELVGFAPEARITDVAPDQVHEFVIARPGYTPVVRVVSPSDFVETDGRLVAEVSVHLDTSAR